MLDDAKRLSFLLFNLITADVLFMSKIFILML